MYKIHREGTASIVIALIFCVGLVSLVNFFIAIPIINYLVYLLSLGFFLFIVSFFRLPQYEVKRDNNVLLCPADGKVVVIEETIEDEIVGGKCKQISIFMSPLNVHVNLFPADGEVIHSQYHPGKYLVAWHPKSSTENERYSTGLLINGYKIGVKQIAGALARRIVNYTKVGDKAEQGKELGFIKFGSRVDVYVPLDFKVNVEMNEKVKGGRTILGSFA